MSVRHQPCGLDVDNCRNSDTGVIDPWVQALIEKSRTYCEITPSKKGLRIIGTGSGEWILKVQKVPAAPGVKLETYRNCNKYITVTGWALPSTPQVLADINELAEAIVAELDKASSRSNSKKDDKKADEELNIEDIAADDPRLASLGADWIELLPLRFLRCRTRHSDRGPLPWRWVWGWRGWRCNRWRCW